MDSESGTLTFAEMGNYNRCLTNMLSEVGTSQFFYSAFDLIDAMVTISHPQAWLCQENEPPVLLTDEIDPLSRESQVAEYLNGHYKSDPAYTRTLGAVSEKLEPYGCHLFTEVQHSDYYEAYYADTEVVDEFTMILPQDEFGINISVMRTNAEEPFTEAEIELLGAMAVTIGAACGQHTATDYWRERPAA